MLKSRVPTRVSLCAMASGLLLVVPLLGSAAPASGPSEPSGPATQNARPCSTPEYRQFDFWIGNWDVYTPNDKLAGANHIEQKLQGCALHESWTSARGGHGNSYSFYDAAAGKWHQTWIDEGGQALYLDGGYNGQSMVLADGANRVTWTPMEGSSVRQLWETTSDGGKTWTTVFDGEYRPISAGGTVFY